MNKQRLALWTMACAAALLLVVFLGWALFVPAADWLARHDIGSATGESLETARNNARGNLLALTAGIAGLGALLFTARNFVLQRRTLQLAEESQRRAEESQRRTLELTEQGQVTERYTKAIEQLGSEKIDIRIGGIYALERIARDSARDHPTVMEVLATFISHHSPAGETHAGNETANARRIEVDIQAALTVIARRESQNDECINLIGGYLGGADLAWANLAGVDLTDSDLTGAYLVDADLTDADLERTNLENANLERANLTRAHLRGTRLSGADLTDSDLTGVDLSNSDLTGVDLTGVDLSGAHVAKSSEAAACMPAGWLVRDDGRIERDPGGQGA